MGVNLAKLRNDVLKAQTGDGRVRYSEKIKRDVLEALAEGIKPSEISIATGLNAPVIFKWRQRSKKTFRKLKVSAADTASATSGVSILLPGGVRIESVSLGFLREILGMFR